MTPRDAWEAEQSARLAEVRRVFTGRLRCAALAVAVLGFAVGFLGAVLR